VAAAAGEASLQVMEVWGKRDTLQVELSRNDKHTLGTAVWSCQKASYELFVDM
jgi:hypothetical protein